MKTSFKVLTAIALSAVSLLSSASLAVNPRILSASATMYASSDLTFYASYAQGALMGTATEFCKSFGEKVDKISNIVLQIGADFSAEGSDKLKAVTNPQVNFSGLVSCQPAAR